jgi:tRNA (guanosine-2'-O-)-methyltransferase
LVFGNEKEGVSEKALEFCDGTFRIPMWGFVESFNVSVAAAISLYISARRRRELLGREGDLSSREEEALMAHYLKLSA